MPDRRDLFTALNVSISSIRVSNSLWSLEEAITAPVNEENFESHRQGCETAKKGINGQCLMIKVIEDNVALLRPNIDEGFDFLKVSRLDAFGDVANAGQKIALANISNANSRAEMAIIAAGLKSHNPKLNKPVTPDMLPIEVNNANILHDLLDVMSLELQGRFDNGELHRLTGDNLNDRIFGRIKSADFYLSLLPKGNDHDELGTLLSYIKNNYLINPISTGQHIDQNLEKLVIVRRSWQWQ